jgi:hypothetical protein
MWSCSFCVHLIYGGLPEGRLTPMKTMFVFVVVAAVLLVAFVVLRSSRSTPNHLNVDPNAAGEIEKAQGR